MSFVAQASFTCGKDLNSDGLFTAAGESATCIATVEGPLCPLDAASCDIPQECPLDATLSCDAGRCERETQTQVPGQCVYTGETPYPTWRCAETGVDYFWPQQPVDAQTICEQQCVVTQTVTETAACLSLAPTCPLGADYACKKTGGSYQCSTNVCSDMKPAETPIDTSMLVDDGARSEDGSCIQQINIFSGRPMECKTDGLNSAFRNCCDEGSSVLQDDITGTSSMISLGIDAASAIYTASTAAWAVYDTALAGGATVEAASAASTEYFTTVLATSGPTIIISAAIIAAIYYYQSACSQTDMETSNMASSGFCHYVGRHCTNKWPTGCVQEARVYCCFNSKIARIVHEQGRPQLTGFVMLPDGLFGSPESPTCNGFNQNEFQALDFSRIDLSEYYADIQSAAQEMKVVPVMQGTIEGKVNVLP